MSLFSGLVQGIADQFGKTAEEGLKVMFILVGVATVCIGLGLGILLMCIGLWISGG